MTDEDIIPGDLYVNRHVLDVLVWGRNTPSIVTRISPGERLLVLSYIGIGIEKRVLVITAGGVIGVVMVGNFAAGALVKESFCLAHS